VDIAERISELRLGLELKLDRASAKFSLEYLPPKKSHGGRGIQFAANYLPEVVIGVRHAYIHAAKWIEQ
jgi:hypothetical protein